MLFHVRIENRKSKIAHMNTNSLLQPVPNTASATPRSDGSLLLDELVGQLKRHVILPAHAAEALALWILHTYAFDLRDISTYLGIESPEKGCGKTTLLRLLGKLVRKPVSTANVSPAALFRVIEELQPTLLIDEGDTFLRNNDELRGILNAGYTPDTAFVLRASSEAKVAAYGAMARGSNGDIGPNASILQRSTTPVRNGFRHFSTWCPKAIAMIGRLPETLADRCIIIRMQKKSTDQKCERLRDLDVADLPARCAEFARRHADAIAKARPCIPSQLGDRTAVIWEPLLVLADLAGADWPELARGAAVGLTAAAKEQNPMAALLLDVQKIFSTANMDRLFTRDLVKALDQLPDRPWRDLGRSRRVTDLWLSSRLRPCGVLPRTIRVNGVQGRGYCREDFGRAGGYHR
jgi:hypothetical protein